MSLNRLSHDCYTDIDDRVSTAYYGSSSVIQLFNNRRKIGRTKNIDIDIRHIKLYKNSLFYHEEHRSRNSLKRSREKKSVEKIHIRNMMLTRII